jgi:hypothetical protein
MSLCNFLPAQSEWLVLHKYQINSTTRDAFVNQFNRQFDGLATFVGGNFQCELHIVLDYYSSRFGRI